MNKQTIIWLLEQVLDDLIVKRGKAEAMIAFCKSRLERFSFKAGYTKPEIELAENWAIIANSPLTAKGEEILRAMQKQYGKKKGKEVFYASINKGTIKGVHKVKGKVE